MIEPLLVHLDMLVCGFGKPRSITLPPTLREMGDRAFPRLDSLESLSFEKGTVLIRESAFAECCRLEKLVFPASLLVIESAAFARCDKLCEITFPKHSQLQFQTFPSSDIE
jgi:hypothetical protein